MKRNQRSATNRRAQNPKTPKLLTFSKNRLRGAKNRSNTSPVAKKIFRKKDFFFQKLCICAKKKFANVQIFLFCFKNRIIMIMNVLEGPEVGFLKGITSGSFENSYIPENPRTLKPLTFPKNRLRGAKNRSNTCPVAKKKFRKNDFFFNNFAYLPEAAFEEREGGELLAALIAIGGAGDGHKHCNASMCVPMNKPVEGSNTKTGDQRGTGTPPDKECNNSKPAGSWNRPGNRHHQDTKHPDKQHKEGGCSKISESEIPIRKSEIPYPNNPKNRISEIPDIRFFGFGFG
ncbi:hypothetical protein LXL04_004738 [Taraxacum kok-saghyz]